MYLPIYTMIYTDTHVCSKTLLTCERGFLGATYVLVIGQLCGVLQVWKKTSVVYLLGPARTDRPGPGHLCQLDHVLHSQLAERTEPDLRRVSHTR